MKYHFSDRRWGASRSFAIALATAVCTTWMGGPVFAAEFSSESGDFSGSWDTTISYGQTWRVQGQDSRMIATANGGKGRSPNIDDGNLNWDTGVVSRTWKVTTELELDYKDKFGGFFRWAGLYDFEVEDDNADRTKISNNAKDEVGTRTELLDAFLYGRFELGEMPLEIRVGEQVVSWGESTFIQGGINVINSINVGALRVPGAELREALLPQGLVWASLGTTDNTSVEAFYQYDWDRIEPEPVGTLFSGNDFAPIGGKNVVLGFGTWSDQGTDWTPLGGNVIPDFNFVPRIDTQTPDDDGQYGVSFRWYMPDVIGGLELGFYFMNYHSRLPLISGRTGTQAGLGDGVGAATAVGAAAQALAAGLDFDSAVTLAANVAVGASAAAGGSYALADATAAATVGANTALLGGDVTGLASAFGIDQFANTAAYFTEYPEDIKLYGLSWNTEVWAGIAWQGDFVYRDEHPLQFDDVEVLFAALSPFEGAIGAGAFAAFGQLGGYPLDTKVKGWDTFETYQIQTTFTKLFGPTFGASQAVLLWEGAVFVVDDMPNRMTGGPNGWGLRLNGPGTSVSGNPNLAGAHFGEIEPDDRFGTKSSWGYRLVGRLDYNNLIGAWNVSPFFAYQDDVNGTSPGPGGSFVEDRQAYTFGLRGSYQNTWQLALNYSKFTGAGRYNLINDRDFIGFSVKASF